MTPAILLAGGMELSAATVPEPSTVIYGKVIHRTNGNEHQLTEGTLVWTLSDQNGTPFTYTTELQDIGETFSYRMNIPHQVLSSGLTVDPTIIPLAAGEARYDFVSITLNGEPARIISTENDFLKLMQNSRAETHRIDLQVSFDLVDTDKDGMPDWWEKQYGLDWQTPDANLDDDGDGWNHLAEFKNGTNPKHDDRIPSLLTNRVAAYGESSNGVWLRAVDANSQASELEFTLTALPTGGHLFLEPAAGGSGPAVALATGDTFTQEQLNQGRLVYRHSDTAVTETTFSVTLGDGVNPPAAADVSIDVFPPKQEMVQAAPGESPNWWRDQNAVFKAYWGLRQNVMSGDLVESALLYSLGKDYGWTLWDQRDQTLPVTIAVAGAGSHFVLGGDGDDVLTGSPQDDILCGGPGTDRLKGGAGADLFMVGNPGLEIIEDFNPLEDVLDLSDLMNGPTGSLNTRLQVTNNGSDSEIHVDGNGDGSGFTDAVIRLQGVTLDQDDLNRLWSQGQLLLGTVQGLQSVTIDSAPTEALEEGYSTGNLVLRRNGPTNSSLVVSFVFSGTATNGTDYKPLPSTLTFAAGKSTATLTIDPLLDGANEYVEQIHFSLSSGATYVLGTTASAQINIVDAKQRFSILADQESAVVGDDPTYLVIRRHGPKSGVVQLLLSIGGTAVKNTEYSAIPTLVTFSDNQEILYLPVQALNGGSLTTGEKSKTVTVSIKPPVPGGGYLLGDPSSATVRLLSNAQDFDTWAAQALPNANPELSRTALTQMTSPRSGMSALLEYASSFGVRLDDGVSAAEQALMKPQLYRDSTGTGIEFSKRLNDPKLKYIVECSSDMIHWHSGPECFESVQLTAAKENAGRVRFRMLNPNEDNNVFMRVRVDLAD